LKFTGGAVHRLFCSCDLDLNPVTLVHELDLSILKMELQNWTEPSRSRPSKARTLRTDRQTHKQMWR